MEKKIGKEWENYEKNTLEILKKFSPPPTSRKTITHTKKIKTSFTFTCNFVGKLVVMRQFFHNYTHPIPFFLSCKHHISIYKIIYFIFCIVLICFKFLCCCVNISLYLYAYIIIACLLYCACFLDGYWTISQDLYGKYPQREEIPSHLGIQGFYFYVIPLISCTIPFPLYIYVIYFIFQVILFLFIFMSSILFSSNPIPSLL